MPDKETIAPKRDARVDEIGFADEVIAEVADPLRAAVKQKHTEPGTRLEGDFFEGLIIGATKRSIDPSKWLHLHNTGKIDRAQFLSAISVSAADAQKILDEKRFAAIVATAPAKNKLTITRKDAVESRVVVAVMEMAQAIRRDILSRSLAA